MATRESQGLQIALIIFVMITLVLCVTTFVYFRKSEEKIQEARKLSEDYKRSERGQREVLEEYNHLKELVGHAPEAKLADIDEAYHKDMTMFAESWPEEKRTYRELPAYLMKEIRDRNVLLTEASDREKKLIADLEQVRSEEKSVTAQAVAGQEKVAAEMVAERAKFGEDRTRYKNDTKKIAKQLDVNRQEVTRIKDESAKQVKVLAEKAATYKALSEAKDAKLKLISNESFESAHGNITFVNQSRRVVYVDLGSRDGLRPQISFSVYDEDASSLANSTNKGSIEVTRVLSGKLAEARIIKDDMQNPLMPGDQVYSPVWRPGRRQRFALVGTLDMDGDGKDDRVKVHNLITMNGGEVDAEVDENGRRIGKLSVNTRYLVEGDSPTEKSSKDVLAGYSNVINDAQQLGIQRISLDKLLSMMGYHGEERTVPLGKRAREEDFRPRPADGVSRKSTGDVSGVFKERKPPTRGARGAY